MHRHSSHCTRGLTAEERLLHYLPDRPTDGCWLWRGATTSSGYGVLSINKKQHRAHRLAYEVWVGPIPDGLTIDHVKARGCTSIRCCNPDHLEAVTDVENLRRGGGIAMQRARQETCVNGHQFDLVRRVGGREYRDCSICRRERGRRHDQKRRPTKYRQEHGSDGRFDWVLIDPSVEMTDDR